MKIDKLRKWGAVVVAAFVLSTAGAAPAIATDTLRIGTVYDVVNFDPQHFIVPNTSVIKNLYDSLIEYTEGGEALPALATSWTIADDGTSVMLTLREGVKFHSGAELTSADLAATLEKGADPQLGRQIYPTMAMVDSWEADGDYELTINFTSAVGDKEILDFLEFFSPIEAAGIETVDTIPAGTGPYVLDERLVGQRITLKANPDYWRERPLADEVVITVFSDTDAAAAAVESGAVDLVYGASARDALRLDGNGFHILSGPGKLVAALRVNTTRAPFSNDKFRLAMNYLMDREGMVQVAFSGLGVPVALPWVPSSPAYDPSYNEEYAFNLDRARELLAESGLSEAEQSAWQIMVNSSDEIATSMSTIAQATLSQVGINVDLDVREGAEFGQAVAVEGAFYAAFAPIGNVQKSPSRVTNNSIYRLQNNPVLGDPHPHPDYVAAIEAVRTVHETEADAQAAYDALNEALIAASFVIPTNTYDNVLIVASDNVVGFLPQIDNMLVARTFDLAD